MKLREAVQSSLLDQLSEIRKRVLVERAKNDEHIKLKHTDTPEEITIIAKISQFSNENIHSFNTHAKTEYFRSKNMLVNQDFVRVFARGLDVKNKNYVCLLCNHYHFRIRSKASYIVSVLDYEGNERFLKSFERSSIEYESVSPLSREYSIERYISLQVLFSNPQELLPNDTLTLQIYIFRIQYYRQNVIPYRTSFMTAWKGDIHLKLDTPFARRLSEESTYFQRVMESPMTEKKSKRLKICRNEFTTFWNISEIFSESQNLLFKTVNELFSMFIVADKYDIPIITENCECFFILCLTVYTVEELLELANEYKNWNFRELLGNLQSKTKETMKNEEGIWIEHPFYGYKWVLKHDRNKQANLDNEVEDSERKKKCCSSKLHKSRKKCKTPQFHFELKSPYFQSEEEIDKEVQFDFYK